MAICVITRNKYRNMYTIKSTYFIAPFQHVSHKKVETCSLLQIKSERSKYLALFHLGFTKNRHRYRPQGKVMFSEASVSHSVHGEGGGGLHPSGVCIGGGSAYRRVCIQDDLPTCLKGGGLCIFGVCLRVCGGWGVASRVGLPMGSLPTGGSASRNAFLFFI